MLKIGDYARHELVVRPVYVASHRYDPVEGKDLYWVLEVFDLEQGEAPTVGFWADESELEWIDEYNPENFPPPDDCDWDVARS